LLLNNSAYGSFLTKKFYNDIINQTSLEGEQSQKKNWAEFKVKEKFELADLEFDNKAKKEFIKFHILYSQIDWTGVISERDIENFEQTNPNAKYLKVIKDKFSQIPKILREEMILPDYTFFDKNDEERSLSDFKGKILYINVWASWCGPCLERRSYFEAIIKDFENEKDEIEFLSISLDRENEKEKWKNVIEKKNYRGIQLIAKDAFKSEICKDLKINMIPRFILVGRDGELIESQAPAAIHSDIRRTLADLILKS